MINQYVSLNVWEHILIILLQGFEELCASSLCFRFDLIWYRERTA